ncbi:unnamed protein product [Pieris brassicae]|uniref:Apolipophorin-III n=1 Tax=Pieris brassicae TaxID=7116 RepID=A0A9P0TL07_PIEBR|nr:unnamed protein product [Pieris brassicae]
MAYKIALLFVCVVVATASARMVRREADSPLKDIQKHAEEFGKTFSEQLNALVNSKNTQEVTKALKDSSDSMLKQLSDFSATLQNALSDANGKAKEALEKSRTNIERNVEELRKSHPEVEQQATALRERLQGAVQNALTETQKLAREVAANMEETNKKLEPQIKKAYDDFVKQAEQVQTKLHEVATKQ